ncbi:MAG TPA: conjugative transposon protein TraM, partial [Bacteroidia bacterium]|nr:conjugative transposon protein TraM [Bacteroidia bacterium]
MKEKENGKPVVRVTEGSPEETADVLQESTEHKMQKLKKPVIFALMGIVFVGCMYLLFKPSEDKKKIETIGLIEAVPQATESKLPDDKGKAYEQELLERKEQEKRNALATLSDYFTSENKEKDTDTLPKDKEGSSASTANNSNPALSSYQNMQSTLGSFYQNDNSETAQLRRQLDELKEKLSEKDNPKSLTVDDQLALMEKSYKMAAKYLPANTGETVPANGTAGAAASQKEYFVAFTPVKKNTTVSA